MNFDQMIDTWKTQDNKPLHNVNHDLLQLVLQHEQVNIRRTLRRDQWVAYCLGPASAVFAAFWLLVACYRGESVLVIIAAGTSTLLFALWVWALWLSRRRQARRERDFGNTLQEEIRRNLSLVEYQLSFTERLGTALSWSLTPVIGAVLLFWLMAKINDNNNAWIDSIILGAAVWTAVLMAYAVNNEAEHKLKPRRQRLAELLETLTASE